MAKASATSTRTARTIQSSFSRTESFLQGFGRGALGGLAAQLTAIVGAGAIFRSFIQNTIEAQEVTARLNAALASTGGRAGLTAEALEEMADALSSVSTFDDEAILAAQTRLLNFGKIGSDIFPRVTQAILDTSKALGKDLSETAAKVGLALQDPIKGARGLRSMLISLSPAEQTVIKNMVETNRLAEAQDLILRRLETSYGGTAKAARDTLGGALDALVVAWGNLFELGGPETRQLQDAIEDLITVISDPEFKTFVHLIGTSLVRAIEDAARVAPTLVSQFQELRQQAENFQAVTVKVFRATPAVASARKSVNFVERMLGSTDDNLDRINAAHEVIQETAEIIKLRDALERKATIAPGGKTIDNGPLRGPVLVDPQQLEDEEAALEAEAEAIKASQEAAKEAERQRKSAAEAIKRQQDAVVELISDLEFENSLIGLSNVEREKEVQLRRAGTVATAEQRAEIERLVEVGESEREALNQLIDRMDTLRDAAGGALSGFMDELREGGSLADGLSAALDRVLDSVLAIIQQQLITSLFGASGTTNGGALGGVFGGLLGGGTATATPRAVGGPVSPGHLYRVGERGPEMFVPRVAGSIVANGRSVGGGTELHFHNAPPVIDRRETRDSQGNTRQDIMFQTALVGSTQDSRTRRLMGLPQQLVRR
jgi:hypothetical protein